MPDQTTIQVAVIGAGNVGSTLADAWERAGHDVAVGVRHPEEAGRAAVDVADALEGAEVVVFAVPGASMPAAIDAHAAALDGTVVIDTTNSRGGDDPLALSGLAYLAERVPSALGFRAFNSTGWENMANPLLAGEHASMPYAGPDGEQRAKVDRLIADVGFEPVYVGSSDDAHHAVDALATLWFALVFGQGRSRRTAFRVLSEG
jgi:predicted dinucleotide-binding enzyme